MDCYLFCLPSVPATFLAQFLNQSMTATGAPYDYLLLWRLPKTTPSRGETRGKKGSMPKVLPPHYHPHTNSGGHSHNTTRSAYTSH